MPRLPLPGAQPRFALAPNSLSTSTTAGRPAASARSRAGRISAGRSTRMPTQPNDSAALARLTLSSKRDVSLTPPEELLLTTITALMPARAAVSSSPMW